MQAEYLRPPEQPLEELAALDQWLRSKILTVQQQIESIDRDLTPIVKKSFEQSEKVGCTVRSWEAQLSINHC